MRFSILIPTRNRLELLMYAVESILKQDFHDWEIIISDNVSEDNIAGYCESLKDSRIRYHRTATLLDVTSNWNCALELSSGEYVIMLGDDDALMKGCLSTLDTIISQYENPECIYMNAFLYAYPGVLPNHPKGILHIPGNAKFLQQQDRPFKLNSKKAQKLVQASLKFKARFGYNMQYVAMSRKIIEKTTRQGKFFHSPYPDYYAINALFLCAKDIIVYPKPLIFIGISPRSFGYYYFNDRESEGVEFLKNSTHFKLYPTLNPYLLPGTNMNDCWLFAMETLAQNFSSIHSLEVHYKKYRLLQIVHTYIYSLHKRSSQNDDELWNRLSWDEKWTYGGLLRVFSAILKRLPIKVAIFFIKVARRCMRTYCTYHTDTIEGEFKNMREVVNKINQDILSESPY